MSSSIGQTALLFGSTGATGKHVLRELLASNKFSRVVEVGRRVTVAEQLANAPGKDKLLQKVVDFEKIGQYGLKNEKADVVIITLGTSRRAAGSAENWVKIDRTYVVEGARAARTDSPSQRIIYVSSTGADLNSSFLYPRSKAETERDLAQLGYGDLMVFRPGFLAHAERSGRGLLEVAVSPVFGALSYLSSGFQIPVAALGKSIVRAAETGSASLPAVAQAAKTDIPGTPTYHVIYNSGAVAMAK